MSFSDIRVASKSEQIRAYSIERALDHNTSPFGQDLICLAKMIEDYITTGDVSGVIQAAVEEGYGEGRFQVKEEVEQWFENVDLDDLFRTKGWLRQEANVNG